jgi:hypothetical protein
MVEFAPLRCSRQALARQIQRRRGALAPATTICLLSSSTWLSMAPSFCWASVLTRAYNTALVIRVRPRCCGLALRAGTTGSNADATRLEQGDAPMAKGGRPGRRQSRQYGTAATRPMGVSKALTPSLTSKSRQIGARRPAGADDFLAPQRRSGPSGQLSPKLPLSEGHRR